MEMLSTAREYEALELTIHSRASVPSIKMFKMLKEQQVIGCLIFESLISADNVLELKSEKSRT